MSMSSSSSIANNNSQVAQCVPPEEERDRPEKLLSLLSDLHARYAATTGSGHQSSKGGVPTSPFVLVLQIGCPYADLYLEFPGLGPKGSKLACHKAVVCNLSPYVKTALEAAEGSDDTVSFDPFNRECQAALKEAIETLYLPNQSQEEGFRKHGQYPEAAARKVRLLCAAQQLQIVPLLPLAATEITFRAFSEVEHMVQLCKEIKPLADIALNVFHHVLHLLGKMETARRNVDYDLSFLTPHEVILAVHNTWKPNNGHCSVTASHWMLSAYLKEANVERFTCESARQLQWVLEHVGNHTYSEFLLDLCDQGLLDRSHVVEQLCDQQVDDVLCRLTPGELAGRLRATMQAHRSWQSERRAQEWLVMFMRGVEEMDDQGGSELLEVVREFRVVQRGVRSTTAACREIFLAYGRLGLGLEPAIDTAMQVCGVTFVEKHGGDANAIVLSACRMDLSEKLKTRWLWSHKGDMSRDAVQALVERVTCEKAPDMSRLFVLAHVLDTHGVEWRHVVKMLGTVKDVLDKYCTGLRSFISFTSLSLAQFTMLLNQSQLSRVCDQYDLLVAVNEYSRANPLHASAIGELGRSLKLHNLWWRHLKELEKTPVGVAIGREALNAAKAKKAKKGKKKTKRKGHS